MTFGRATKSVLVLDGGTVIGCGLTYRTMMARLNGDMPSESEAEAEAKWDEEASMSTEAEEAPETEEAE